MNKTQLLENVKKLRDNGITSLEINNWLISKGSSLPEIHAVSKYGEDAITKSRESVNELKSKQQLVRPFKVAGDVIQEIPDIAMTAAEIPVNAATFGGYNWANKQLGGSAQERSANVNELISQAPSPLRGAAQGGKFLAEIGGGVANRLVRQIPIGMTGNLAKDTLVGGALGSGMSAIRSAFDSNFNQDEIKSGASTGAIIGGVIPGLSRTGQGVGNLVKSIKAAKITLSPDQYRNYIIENATNPNAEKGLRRLAKTPYGEELKKYAYELDNKIRALQANGTKLSGLQTIDDTEIDELLGNKAYRSASQKYGELISPQMNMPVLTTAERNKFLQTNNVLEPLAANRNLYRNIEEIQPGTIAELDYLKKQASEKVSKSMLNPNTDIRETAALLKAKNNTKDIIEKAVPGLRSVSNEMNAAKMAGKPNYDRIKGIVANLSTQARSPASSALDVGAGSAVLGGIAGGSPTTTAVGASILVGKYLNNLKQAGAVKNAILGNAPIKVSPGTVDSIIKALGQQGN